MSTATITKSVDFYAALGLQPTCGTLDVKTAFRRAALLLHPDRSRLNATPQFAPLGDDAGEREDRRPCTPADDRRRFEQAAHAYEVLVDPPARAIYDLHGCQSLPPFHGDPGRTFRKFFGTDNPFLAQLRDRVHFNVDEPEPPETAVLVLRVSLSEINDGVVKTLTACLRVPAAAPGGGGGEATALADRAFSVDVEPGALPGTRYTFPKQGHQDPGRPPGDVAVELQELPHLRFSRHGADLVQAETVSLRQALTGCTVQILTLDERLIRVAITDIVRPGYEKRISGEGLPVVGADRARARARGDLIVRLDVRFPLSLTATCKSLLTRAFQLDEEEGCEAARARGGAGGVARALLDDKMRREAAA